MTEEIKEILNKLKYIVDFPIIEHDASFNSDNVEESVCLLISNECQLLLDYITNLQQLYENGLKVNQSSHKYITELEMNNAILKEDLDKANDIIEKDRQFYKCRMDEYVDYKSRLEKASNKLDSMFTNGEENKILDDLLELDKIVKGDKQ